MAQSAEETQRQASPQEDARGGVTVESPSRIQRLVAQRMVDAHSIPVFVLNADVEASALVAWRNEAKANQGAGRIPTVNDAVVKASALALRGFPRINASYGEDGFALYERINIGVAVSTDAGLLVPVVRDADKKDLAAIAEETRDLAERARTRRLTPGDLDGGTFTVSNLGMFGVTSFTPIINSPQAGILGVGAVIPRGTEYSMTLTFVGDHRIVNGADGARFLAKLVELLSRPS